MGLAVLLAVAIGMALILLLARYAKSPAVLRMEHRARGRHAVTAKPEIDPKTCVELVAELLAAMGLRVVEVQSLGRPGASRLVAMGTGPLRSARHVVYVEAAPVGREVGAPLLLELAEDVTHGEVALGMVVTPYAIDDAGVAGMKAELELIDGAALLALVEEHLPERAAEMREYHLGEGGSASRRRATRGASRTAGAHS